MREGPLILFATEGSFDQYKDDKRAGFVHIGVAPDRLGKNRPLMINAMVSVGPRGGAIHVYPTKDQLEVIIERLQAIHDKM